MREYVYCRKSFIVYNIDSEYLCLSKVVTDLQGQRQIRLSFRSHSIKLTLEPSRQPLNVRITPKRLKKLPPASSNSSPPISFALPVAFCFHQAHHQYHRTLLQTSIASRHSLC